MDLKPEVILLFFKDTFTSEGKTKRLTDKTSPPFFKFDVYLFCRFCIRKLPQ